MLAPACSLPRLAAPGSIRQRIGCKDVLIERNFVHELTSGPNNRTKTSMHGSCTHGVSVKYNIYKGDNAGISVSLWMSSNNNCWEPANGQGGAYTPLRHWISNNTIYVENQSSVANLNVWGIRGNWIPYAEARSNLVYIKNPINGSAQLACDSFGGTASFCINSLILKGVVDNPFQVASPGVLNPQDYLLKSGSTAINYNPDGTNNAPGLTKDFGLRIRADGIFDAGAWEFGATGGDTTAPNPPTNVQVQ